VFQDCEVAPDAECCRQLHHFSVDKSNYFEVGATGCAAVCALIERDGEDGACMPEMVECDTFLPYDSWPEKADGTSHVASVGAYCTCGARSRARVADPNFPDFTILKEVPAADSGTTGFTRRLDPAGEPWHWDEVRSPATPSPWESARPPLRRSQPSENQAIDIYHSDHLTASDTCLASAYNFRLSNIQQDTESANYSYLLRPPIASWSPQNLSGYADCRSEDADPAHPCVAEKGIVSASRTYLMTADARTRSFTEAFALSFHIGSRVYEDESMAVGDLDGDGIPDVLVGNRAFFSTQTPSGKRFGDFSGLSGTTLGSKTFSRAWIGDVDGISPNDIVAQHPDGSMSVYIALRDEFQGDRLTRQPTGGIGFRRAGTLIEGGGARVNTVSFVKTIEGVGSNCRFASRTGRYGCVNSQNALFLGTGANYEDLIWTSSGSSVPLDNVEFSEAGKQCGKHASGIWNVPVRSEQACRDAASALGTEFRELRNDPVLPPTTCLFDTVYLAIVFNLQTADPAPLPPPPLTDTIQLVCATPELQFAGGAPPAAPQNAHEATDTLGVYSCRDIENPCDCCRAHELVGDGYSCAPPKNAVEGASCLAKSPANQVEFEDCSAILYACERAKVSSVFSPLVGSQHETFDSTTFFLDANDLVPAIAAATAEGSPNFIYLSVHGFASRPIKDSEQHRSTSVSAARITGAILLGGGLLKRSMGTLLCFGNANDRNSCNRIGIDPGVDVPDLSGVGRRLQNCDMVELENTQDDPIKYTRIGARPMYPYPFGESILEDGQVRNDRTWEQCKELCMQTPGCMYVYQPEVCRDGLGSLTTWTGATAGRDFESQCFLFDSFEAPVPRTADPSDYRWVSSDWCSGSASAPVGTYRHAYSSCAGSTAGTQSHLFGHPDEVTTDIHVGDLDGDGLLDVVTLSARDYVRIYRGTSDTQTTGNFGSVVPETTNAFFSNQESLALLFSPPPPPPPVTPPTPSPPPPDPCPLPPPPPCPSPPPPPPPVPPQPSPGPPPSPPPPTPESHKIHYYPLLKSEDELSGRMGTAGRACFIRDEDGNGVYEEARSQGGSTEFSLGYDTFTIDSDCLHRAGGTTFRMTYAHCNSNPVPCTNDAARDGICEFTELGKIFTMGELKQRGVTAGGSVAAIFDDTEETWCRFLRAKGGACGMLEVTPKFRTLYSGGGATCRCLDKGDTSYTLAGTQGVTTPFHNTDYPYGGSYRFREGYHWTGLNDMCSANALGTSQDATVSASQAGDVTEAIKYWSYAGPTPLSTTMYAVHGKYWDVQGNNLMFPGYSDVNNSGHDIGLGNPLNDWVRMLPTCKPAKLTAACLRRTTVMEERTASSATRTGATATAESTAAG